MIVLFFPNRTNHQILVYKKSVPLGHQFLLKKLNNGFYLQVPVLVPIKRV